MSVPNHKKAILWSMKQKQNPVDKIIKWKACLCAGGHNSIEMVDYWSTIFLVASFVEHSSIIVCHDPSSTKVTYGIY